MTFCGIRQPLKHPPHITLNSLLYRCPVLKTEEKFILLLVIDNNIFMTKQPIGIVLKMGSIGCPAKSVKNYHYCCVITQKSKLLIH
jgi:hypothetical protein